MKLDVGRVTLRLKDFGYIVAPEDAVLLDFYIDKVLTHIYNYCHIRALPEGLIPAATEMVCGDFLYTKMACGGIGGKTYERMVKSVSEGDVRVDFAGETSAQAQFETFVAGLRGGHEQELRHFRKLVW